MDYPKNLVELHTLAYTNEDVLRETYGLEEGALDTGAMVPEVVALYNLLKDDAENINGAILQIFASAAYHIQKHNFFALGHEAEPLFFAARDRLSAL
jgi:hypothetical protein